MAADTIVESIQLEVLSEKRKGQGGKDYETLYVEYNGKKWTVGKKSSDRVKRGEKYDFNLQKSEWKDKIYYWANLNDDSGSEEAPRKDEPSQGPGEVTNTQIVEYFRALSLEKKLRMLQYLIGVLGEK